jgi:hypothetical protein
VLHEQRRQEKYFRNRWNGVCRQQQLKQVTTVQERSWAESAERGQRSASSVLSIIKKVCTSCLVIIFLSKQTFLYLRIIKKDKERGKAGISLYLGKQCRSS